MKRKTSVRCLFLDIGGVLLSDEGLGIRSILHTDYRTTRSKLASLSSRDDSREGHRAS